MATIMFLPLPEIGHLNPTMKLASGLKLGGHQVYFLGILDFEEYIISQGLEFIPVFKDSCPKGFLHSHVAGNDDDLASSGIEALRAIVASSYEPFKELKGTIQSYRPDLMITDIIFYEVAVMAANAGLPSVLISASISEVHRRFANFKAAPSMRFPVLVFCPREFDFPSKERRNGEYHIEASVDFQRKELPFLWSELDENRPLIYCSLGSQTQTYKHCRSLFMSVIEAMRTKRDHQLVLASGAYLEVNDFQPVPPNVHVVKTAPQLAMLKKSSMMITHGGLGSIKECILSAVPMIVFPGAVDQPGNAARVVYHGLGLRGDMGSVSAQQICLMIDRINNQPSFKQRVALMSQRFKEIEASGRGTRIIEKLLNAKTTDRGP
jgi:UDP:flavonoid glycosyltransferase YjiC (YdhE family)